MDTVRLAARAQALRLSMWKLGLRRQKPWDGRAIALHDYKAVCYLIPKVACSSLTAACVDLLGFNLPDNAWKPAVFRDSSYDGLIDRDKRDAAKVNEVEANGLEGYWRYSFVRNPYDRLISCYSEKIRPDGPAEHFENGVARGLLKYKKFWSGMSFPEFAQVIAEIPDKNADGHFRSQTSFLVGSSGQLTMDFIGKYESLQQDIARVADHLGVAMELPHLLKSKRGKILDYYDDYTRDVVWKRYQDDFRLLGYDSGLPEIEA